MYTKEATEQKQTVPVAYYIVAVVSILINIIIGVYPSLVTNLLN